MFSSFPEAHSLLSFNEVDERKITKESHQSWFSGKKFAECKSGTISPELLKSSSRNTSCATLVNFYQERHKCALCTGNSNENMIYFLFNDKTINKNKLD